MQSGRPQRAQGSFSPLPGSINTSAAAAAAVASARPQIRRIESSSSDDSIQQISISKARSPQSPIGVTSPSYASFSAIPQNSGQQPQQQQQQNFSRPGRPSTDAPSVRTASPLTLPSGRSGHHTRKLSQTQGLFDSTLPSTSMSNLSQIGMSQPTSPSSAALTASQIAAQAAMQHQNQHQQHNRHRSQTVPFPGGDTHDATRRAGNRLAQGSDGNRGPLSPPMLSLTEASVPRDATLGGSGNPGYHNGLLGSHSQAATTAANVVFPRTSPQSSPGLPTQESYQPQQITPSPYPAPLSIPEKPVKPEKSKVKLFSRPKRIETKGDSKEKPLPSPGKIGSALASLQRGNYSTASLVESSSMYSLANSSSATIRPIETTAEKESTKEKEKKHHFLSRGKHKLSSKDDYHLPLSSASSNSRPVDPNAPSSLYNFHLPPSPGPNSTSFGKSVSGLDLRHGGRALREKRKEDKLGMAHDNESLYTLNSSEWPPSSSLGSSLGQSQSQFTLLDPVDSHKYGLNNMTLDDAWPYLKAKLLVIFEGEDLRLPIEDFNKVVTMHVQYCIQRRSAYIVIEDLRELLSTGFSSLDHTLRNASEDRLIPALVDVWMVTFTSILPYMQAVFLPLDLEFSGTGPLLTLEQARDFWGGVLSNNGRNIELSSVLDVRRMVLLAFRDALILPRYDKLKTIFSRLSLEHLPSSLASLALASPPPVGESVMSSSPRDINIDPLGANRPGTAMSLDPSVASYNSSSSTLLGEGSNPSRSRAISNVSFGSGASGGARGRAGSDREARDQTAESGSKQVTDMVGRMLQCMSVLASVGGSGGLNLTNHNTMDSVEDDGSKMVSELGRLLKLNWLGRGRTGRNRRGMVGGRVKREQKSDGAHIRAFSSSGIGLGVGLNGNGSSVGGMGSLNREAVGVSG
ncbi:HbrB-like-domain-containing protein [Xylariales sp. PMI_506]|nr:HbrB-like-domain-containing protein [Xylariales sp. PMI_506]